MKVAHWKLNEQSGTVINDSSENTNTGTWAGTGAQALTSVKSTSGRGLLFDGVDDKITVPADSSIDINGKTRYSCSAWIDPASDGENDLGRIIAKTDNAGSPTKGYNFFVTGEASGNVKIKCQVMHVTRAAIVLSISTIIPLNEFSHVAFVYNEDGAKKVKLYLNSVLVSLDTDQSGDGDIVDDSVIDLTIGNATEDTTRTFDGTISDVRIFDEALPVAKIRSIYENGITPYFRSRYAGTVAHRNLRRRFSPNSSL